MIGRTLGAFDGRAHADAVAKGSAAVSPLYSAYFRALELLQPCSLSVLQRA